MTINSQILLGEDGKPSAVQIPYDQFVEIAEALGLDLPDGEAEELREALADSRAGRRKAFTSLDLID
jgi:PHD/YefM family antitoxin component YafN of YafNO toxin-antitoxin module